MCLITGFYLNLEFKNGFSLFKTQLKILNILVQSSGKIAVIAIFVVVIG